jgi:hypothetical protein
MEDILRTLAQQGELTPNHIGMEVCHGMPPIQGGRGQGGRGKGSRTFGDAQRVIFPLNRLRDLGLVYVTSRPDGLSGTAYGITAEGKKAIAS